MDDGSPSPDVDAGEVTVNLDAFVARDYPCNISTNSCSRNNVWGRPNSVACCGFNTISTSIAPLVFLFPTDNYYLLPLLPKHLKVKMLSPCISGLHYLSSQGYGSAARTKSTGDDLGLSQLEASCTTQVFFKNTSAREDVNEWIRNYIPRNFKHRNIDGIYIYVDTMDMNITVTVTKE